MSWQASWNEALKSYPALGDTFVPWKPTESPLKVWGVRGGSVLLLLFGIYKYWRILHPNEGIWMSSGKRAKELSWGMKNTDAIEDLVYKTEVDKARKTVEEVYDGSNTNEKFLPLKEAMQWLASFPNNAEKNAEIWLFALSPILDDLDRRLKKANWTDQVTADMWFVTGFLSGLAIRFQKQVMRDIDALLALSDPRGDRLSVIYTALHLTNENVPLMRAYDMWIELVPDEYASPPWKEMHDAAKMEDDMITGLVTGIGEDLPNKHVDLEGEEMTQTGLANSYYYMEAKRRRGRGARDQVQEAHLKRLREAWRLEQLAVLALSQQYKTAFLLGEYHAYADVSTSSKLFDAGLKGMKEMLTKISSNPDLEPEERRQLREYHMQKSACAFRSLMTFSPAARKTLTAFANSRKGDADISAAARLALNLPSITRVERPINAPVVLATEVEEEINKFEERERRAAKLQKKPYKEMTPAEKDRLRASLLQEISARETQFARYEQAKKEAQAKAKEKKKEDDEEDENEKEEPEEEFEFTGEDLLKLNQRELSQKRAEARAALSKKSLWQSVTDWFNGNSAHEKKQQETAKLRSQEKERLAAIRRTVQEAEYRKQLEKDKVEEWKAAQQKLPPVHQVRPDSPAYSLMEAKRKLKQGKEEAVVEAAKEAKETRKELKKPEDPSGLRSWWNSKSEEEKQKMKARRAYVPSPAVEEFTKAMSATASKKEEEEASMALAMQMATLELEEELEREAMEEEAMKEEKEATKEEKEAMKTEKEVISKEAFEKEVEEMFRKGVGEMGGREEEKEEKRKKGGLAETLRAYIDEKKATRKKQKEEEAVEEEEEEEEEMKGTAQEADDIMRALSSARETRSAASTGLEEEEEEEEEEAGEEEEQQEEGEHETETRNKMDRLTPAQRRQRQKKLRAKMKRSMKSANM